jgi:hypothetical protein
MMILRMFAIALPRNVASRNRAAPRTDDVNGLPLVPRRNEFGELRTL